MTGQRVLVTGVGGQPGFDLARRLDQLGATVIGVDADPLANGLLVDGIRPRGCPHVDDPRYGEELLKLCTVESVDAVAATVESELPALIGLAEELTVAGTRTWLPSRGAAAACRDKAVFATVLTEAGVAHPRTWLPDHLADAPADGQFVVKPRTGQGSQGVIVCQGRDRARAACLLVAEPIVQTRLTGTEFTADCLVGDDRRAGVVLRWRLLTKGGLSIVTRTFTDPAIDALVRATLAAVGIRGWCCVQGFATDTGPLITEVNARPAGAFLAAEAAGADLTGQYLAALLGGPIDYDRLTYRAGVTLTKFVDTLAITTGDRDARTH
ncbi:ATP-grasp domain-containing protein [Nocardia asteroides]|uniref:ATP-grasp domain-containing protein n=1 Tax=Nocardia asteroides TaxID=1824 RepID=UPI001E2C79B6|nr:ATP-grasp domain-containing protein [Nocardia asteroides]UGT58875.1 ATP-grasp domain-containing protein [Nocardia asteroides]